MSSVSALIEKHHFLLRRLHSLTGVAPIGVFLIMHLTTNSSVVWGAVSGKPGHEVFDHEVAFIHSLPALLLIEVFGLWLPIAFHSILGFYYAFSGKANLSSYQYQSNWRYTLQRISGYVGFFFILYHVATLRWGWDWLPFSSTFDGKHAAYTTAMALKGGATEVGFGAIVVSLFYLLGVSMLVFHFANGLWTAAITWGLTVSTAAQKRWGYVCAGLGAGMMAMGWMSVFGFLLLDLDDMKAPPEPEQDAALVQPAHTADEPAIALTSDRKGA